VRESDFSLMPSKKLFPLYHGKNKLLIVLKRDDDDDIRFILYQRVELDFYSASSLKQQSYCSTLRQLVFAHTH
jgi:hypothetical protein